jgi:ribosome-binding factor A
MNGLDIRRWLARIPLQIGIGKVALMDYRRCDRVADVLRQEIAELIFRRVKDPRVNNVTVTGVDVSADLKNAKVYYCVMGVSEVETKESTAEGLKKAKGFIRLELGKRLRMKSVPQLEFHYDTSFEYGDKIERLLKELHGDE